jgi:hypothetical protein
MSELTKEHFDQLLKGLATKADLKGLATKEELKGLATKADLKGVATKDDLVATERRLVKRIDEAQEELARMVASGFEDVQRRLDVTAQVKEHERKLRLIAEQLHITF